MSGQSVDTHEATELFVNGTLMRGLAVRMVINLSPVGMSTPHPSGLQPLHKDFSPRIGSTRLNPSSEGASTSPDSPKHSNSTRRHLGTSRFDPDALDLVMLPFGATGSDASRADLHSR